MPICANCGLPASEDSRFCSRCGQALAEPASHERRVQVTVLFCDMVGSTRLGEALDPEALRAVQARYFAVCSEALLRHGGEVEKFIGDAVMCVFGLPRAHEDDAMRGCRAALDLVAAVKRLSDELGVEIGQRLAVRVGVHTGEAVAGDSSGGQALVTGDAVNTAARLEQAAGTGEILLGEPTYQLVAGAVQADRVEAVPAQGKAQPVPAYRLRGLSLVRRAVGEQSPLVGRDGELAELRGTLERVIDHRRAELVVLVGEAGIGKSRLVAELVAALPPGGRALTGQCASYGEGVTYWPLREMVEELGGEDERTLEALLASAPGAAERVFRAIGRRHGPLERKEAFRAFAQFAQALARRGPLILVVEDLHWAEPTLLDLLEYLAEVLHAAPVLLLGTARPEIGELRPELTDRAVRLASLPADAAAQLVEGRLALDPGRRDEVLRAAGGNPLFLEQLAAADGGDRVGAVPPTLRALLGARIDALDRSERKVLETAAVVGREFWPAALGALLGRREASGVAAQLAVLERRELIAPGRADVTASRAPAGLSGIFGAVGRFSFRHALIRDVAYAGMAKAARAELHERFAPFLEQHVGARADEYRALVGWHLEQAARLRAELQPGAAPTRAAGRAASALEAAGRQALELDDPRAAEKLLSRAAALLPDESDRRAAVEEVLERSRAGSEPVAAELGPGEKVAGYEIESLAGRGGMGVVYRARDPRLGRSVGLKVIGPAFARNAGFRERFQRESRMAARIEHFNVIPVYDAGEADGRLYIAMRFVEGTDLASLIAGEGRLDSQAAASLLAQVGQALDAAHAGGLVHRDVKPANVLLAGPRGEERAFLTDFGLSIEPEADGGLTQTGHWVGTLAYVAPEQIRGGKVGARTDVYALGGVLHHCLTGQVPYPSQNELDALYAHLSEPPPRPSEVVPELPQAWDEVVARAMSKDPAARFPSAGDLGRAALAAARGERLPREERSVATGVAAEFGDSRCRGVSRGTAGGGAPGLRAPPRRASRGLL